MISINENDHVLVVTMHHIASDGWSLSIMVKEVVELYSAYQEESFIATCNAKHTICRLFDLAKSLSAGRYFEQ
jgi:NRPS condensation-like uncharacterized protein